jgi:hypothetical protein
MARFTLGFRLIFLNKQQTFNFFAIRPGYPSVIIRQSIASLGFCQVNFMKVPSPLLGWMEYPCPSGQITLRHTSTPVALTP